MTFLISYAVVHQGTSTRKSGFIKVDVPPDLSAVYVEDYLKLALKSHATKKYGYQGSEENTLQLVRAELVL